jgi:hypothetical protein
MVVGAFVIVEIEKRGPISVFTAEILLP